ncbi:hypothetical protein [Agrobacterium phage Atu_ph04]|uniref:Uncharacterized protein n=1 Tax=Agrobacterium phage Atu_ph04 TaxID=2024263 RepID=A0A223VZK9_9CAUD|nr:hypothetical protein PP941_gp03 [Agrobacterium phage Atu_ph04]ASV44595.1 hypothetical protein [Agrobacterium phage Atu_ph04]
MKAKPLTEAKILSVPAIRVLIFMAGDIAKAKKICQEYCDAVGLCVTVDSTEYVYSGGSESGFTIGLINYARFPKTREDVWHHARTLAVHLLNDLDQLSFTIQDDRESVFFSWRDYV